MHFARRRARISGIHGRNQWKHPHPRLLRAGQCLCWLPVGHCRSMCGLVWRRCSLWTVSYAERDYHRQSSKSRANHSKFVMKHPAPLHQDMVFDCSGSPRSQAKPLENEEVGRQTECPYGQVSLSEQKVRIGLVRLDHIVAQQSFNPMCRISAAGAIIKQDRCGI